jgi:hypothetical protein
MLGALPPGVRCSRSIRGLISRPQASTSQLWKEIPCVHVGGLLPSDEGWHGKEKEVPRGWSFPRSAKSRRHSQKGRPHGQWRPVCGHRPIRAARCPDIAARPSMEPGPRRLENATQQQLVALVAKADLSWARKGGQHGQVVGDGSFGRRHTHPIYTHTRLESSADPKMPIRWVR